MPNEDPSNASRGRPRPNHHSILRQGEENNFITGGGIFTRDWKSDFYNQIENKSFKEGSRSEVEETGNYLAVNDVRFLTNLYPSRLLEAL